MMTRIRKAIAPVEATITRKVHWTSQNGKWVVVRGPFPNGFARTLTAKSLDHAIMRRVSADYDEGIMARKETTNDHYAKTLRKLVIDTDNDWGEVCP